MPSCDSRGSIYSANSRPVSLAAPARRPLSGGQNNATNRLFISQFLSDLLSIFIRDLLSLILLLHLPPVSSGPEWQLALGKPVRGRARRPTLPLLSDLAEHATALHRFGAAPRRQRGQVSSVPDAWILSKSQGVS